MSSTSRGTARGRGRGNGQAPRGQSNARGTFAGRGTARGGLSQRGATTFRGNFGQASRADNGARAGGFGAASGTKAQGFGQRPAQAGAFGGLAAKEDWAQRLERLEKARQNERKQAIRDGLMADPDKPRSLADAITPVGTCQEMCAEFERVQRVVQADVWKEEADPEHPSYGSMSQEPIEAHMVKKFRRAAAGLEEQLPSDLRPPLVLKRTLDYLLEEVIGNAPALHNVHGFVWDRTRAIRNDFSIQQCTKTEDLRLAIDCYERIARFHIVSLHQLAISPKPYDAYDPQQEREQLDRTLLSLMQYYDDVRGRLSLPNEAEFRAYCVIKQLQDPTPDLEDRIQCWPLSILDDKRVRTALDLYAAACNAMDSQGPLKPRATHLIAQQDWQKFWRIISSPKVSYLMACVAEIYFNLIRRTVLNALWRACNGNPRAPPQEMTIEYLAELMKLDEEDQVRTFCEGHGFSFADGADGEYLNLSSVKGSSLPNPDRNLPRQWKSSLVEDKRFGRTIPAIVNGLSVRRAADAGQIVEEEHEEDMEDAKDGMSSATYQGVNGAVDDGESLFLPETELTPAEEYTNPFARAGDTALNGTTSNTSTGSAFTFGQPSQGTFGKPSSGGSIFNAKPAAPTSTFGKPSRADDVFASKSQDATDEFAKQPAEDSIFSRKPVAPSTSLPAWNLNAPTAASRQADQATSASTTAAASKAPAFDLPKFTPGTFSFGSQLAAPQSTQPTAASPASSFGDFSQTQRVNRSPSIPDSDEGSSTQTFPWAAKAKDDQKGNTATPGLLDVHKQSAVETAQTSAATIVLEQPQNETTATSSPEQQQTSKPEAKQNQPHFTPATSSAAPATSPPTSPTQQLRKPSTSHNKPNKPSPLANSFTFEDVSNPTAFGPSPTKQRAERQQGNAPPVEDLDATIGRIAREVTLEGGGIIDQYISFTVEKLIRSVKEEVELERDARAATEFRTHVLSHRYFHRWKSIFWAKRFEQRGNKRRERARKGLEEFKRSQRSESTTEPGMGSVASFFAKSTGSSHRASTSSKSQQPIINGNPTALEQQQARVRGARPLFNAAAPPREDGPKRLKGLSHVDDRGRIAKPAPTTSGANADLLRRSSYLGFSGQTHAKEGSSITTRDPYFRLKAMGIKSRPGVESRGLKRRHEDDDDMLSRSSAPAARSRTSSLLRSSLDGDRDGDAMPPPTLPASANHEAIARCHSGAAKSDEDDALFARLRAARAALEESTTFMKAEVEMAEDMRRSLSASESSNESPSMARARAEARWRASHGGSIFAASASNGADVPAYRLRESRFVPREHYGRAIERANELRTSRSVHTSRPQSRTEVHVGDLPVTATSATITKHAINKETSSLVAPSLKSPEILTGFSQPSWQPPAAVLESSHLLPSPVQRPSFGSASARNSTSGNISSSRSHLESGLSQRSFIAGLGTQNSPATGDSTQQILGSVQTSGGFDWASMATNGQGGEVSEDAVHDFTVPRSQVQQTLQNSFGSSQPLFVGPTSPFAEMVRSPQSQQVSHQDSGNVGNSSDEENQTQEEQASQPPYATEPTQQPQNNVFDYRAVDEELLDPSADRLDAHNSYMHTNPFALLSNEAVEGDTEEDVDEEDGKRAEYEDEDGIEVDDSVDGYAREDEVPEDGTESAGDYDENGLSDIDNEEFDEGDDDNEALDLANTNGSFDHRTLADEEHDDEYDETDQGSEDEDGEAQGLQNAHFWNQPPAKNEALRGVGQTEADAIELDSD